MAGTPSKRLSTRAERYVHREFAGRDSSPNRAFRPKQESCKLALVQAHWLRAAPFRFRRRCHHRARGIFDGGGRLALRPIDRAVGGGVAGGGARPFPEAHCRTSKAKAPP